MKLLSQPLVYQLAPDEKFSKLEAKSFPFLPLTNFLCFKPADTPCSYLLCDKPQLLSLKEILPLVWTQDIFIHFLGILKSKQEILRTHQLSPFHLLLNEEAIFYQGSDYDKFYEYIEKQLSTRASALTWEGKNVSSIAHRSLNFPRTNQLPSSSLEEIRATLLASTVDDWVFCYLPLEREADTRSKKLFHEALLSFYLACQDINLEKADINSTTLGLNQEQELTEDYAKKISCIEEESLENILYYFSPSYSAKELGHKSSKIQSGTSAKTTTNTLTTKQKNHSIHTPGLLSCNEQNKAQYTPSELNFEPQKKDDFTSIQNDLEDRSSLYERNQSIPRRPRTRNIFYKILFLIQSLSFLSLLYYARQEEIKLLDFSQKQGLALLFCLALLICSVLFMLKQRKMHVSSLVKENGFSSSSSEISLDMHEAMQQAPSRRKTLREASKSRFFITANQSYPELSQENERIYLQYSPFIIGNDYLHVDAYAFHHLPYTICLIFKEYKGKWYLENQSDVSIELNRKKLKPKKELPLKPRDILKIHADKWHFYFTNL